MGMGNSRYVLVILSLAIFLIPISQANAVLLVPIEISDEVTFESWKKSQKFKAEQLRQIYFDEYLKSTNPYNEEIPKVVIFFSDNELIVFDTIHRYDDNIQEQKDEQRALAHEKFLEIMGGKSLESFENFKTSDRNLTVLKFNTDEQDHDTNSIHRFDDSFQISKEQQIIIAKETADKLIEEGYWSDDPFVIDEMWEYEFVRESVQDRLLAKQSVDAAFDLVENEVYTMEELIEEEVIEAEDLIQDNVISADYLELFWKSYEPPKIEQVKKIDKVKQVDVQIEDDFDWDSYEWKNSARGSEEFQNILTEQALSAEQTRDKLLGLLQYENPYEENVDVSVNNQNIIAITFSEDAQNIIAEITPMLERHEIGFEEYKEKQIELAQKIMNEKIYFERIYEDEKSKQSLADEKFVIPKIYERDDMFFNLLKKVEQDKANEKLMEIMGGKIIPNDSWK